MATPLFGSPEGYFGVNGNCGYRDIFVMQVSLLKLGPA